MAVLTDVVTESTRKRSFVTFPEYRQGRTPPNKGMTLPPEPLTADEVHRLVNACARRGPSGIRNRALIVLMWRSGLRVSEALALYPRDIDQQHGTINVLRGKGAKHRTVGIDDGALEYVNRWLDKRRELGITGHSPLFCTISEDWGGSGRPIRSSYVRQLLKRLAVDADIDKRVHPHGLRHTHAYELSMEGVPVDVIRKQLGHSNLGTTARYIDHIAPAAVVEAIRARSWTDG